MSIQFHCVPESGLKNVIACGLQSQILLKYYFFVLIQKMFFSIFWNSRKVLKLPEGIRLRALYWLLVDGQKDLRVTKGIKKQNSIVLIFHRPGIPHRHMAPGLLLAFLSLFRGKLSHGRGWGRCLGLLICSILQYFWLRLPVQLRISQLRLNWFIWSSLRTGQDMLSPWLLKLWHFYQCST